MIYFLAGLLTFPITTALTVAGVGAAFVLIPIFTTLGFPLHQSMAVALLLNSLAMLFALVRYIRNKLVLWKLSIPLIITITIGAPLGVKLSYIIDSSIIIICFICFLVFAAIMIFTSKTKKEEDGSVTLTPVKIVLSGFAGLIMGVLAGLLGVGGGNIVLPTLLALGTKPKEAIGTTAVIVVFSSTSGFIGHIGMGSVDWLLVAVAAGAAIAGAIVGSWLMTDKLNPETIKKVLGVVLIAFAIKMAINLIFGG
jgi:uncharacterized protein